MLSALSDIKKLRMSNAQAEATRKRQQVAQCQEKEKQAQNELLEYEAWRAQEEQRLYEDIKGTAVGLKELDKVKHQISLLRLKEVSLRENIEQAIQERQQAETDLDQAEAALLEASKAFEKCQMLVEQVNEAENAEAQRQEDLELEEASETGFQRPSN